MSIVKEEHAAKKIKNAAVVNENPADKMIRELKEENERLKKLLEGKGIDTGAAQGAGSAVDDAKVKEDNDANDHDYEQAHKQTNSDVDSTAEVIRLLMAPPLMGPPPWIYLFFFPNDSFVWVAPVKKIRFVVNQRV